MDVNLINYGLAFVEGFALILSPCILPILPIILSGGLTGGKYRPAGIIIGFTLFFAIFSLLSGSLIRHIGLNFDLIRKISYLLIIIFGVILFSDYLSNIFSRLTQSFADTGAAFANKNNNSGFISGVLFGGLVSIIWVPCGGPILAAAIVNMAVQKTFLASFITFLCFAFGSVLPMILIALAGKKIMAKTTLLKKHSHLLRKIFGLIIIMFAIIAGFTGTSAAWIVSKTTNMPSTKALEGNTLIGALPSSYPAPALNSDTIWLNSPPLTMQALKGKVVLIDFWTYSCINCIRTLPYLKDWYNKYHDKGLVIIGVHAPEFEFEKNVNNVKQAIAQYGIHYPVVLDNNYVIWQHYNNQYWPAHYLIDKNGQVVYQHFGEGLYDETEHNIRILLGLSGTTMPLLENTTSSSIAETPETYLGYARGESYAGIPNALPDAVGTYQFPITLAQDAWALSGKWLIQSESIQSFSNNAAIKIHFFANHVYAVIGSKNGQPIKANILLNGKPLEQSVGKEANQSSFTVSKYNLYPVLNFSQPTEGELELQFDKPGAEVYTFTFG
ncbi:MAG: cytochrome c biogenesis protein DipZ [Legionellales bacterium]|nr:cytochrome c biogenesis protein DipZ [Legionellales bacterium]